MSTHGCFSPSFPPFLSTWLSQPDAGVQEPDATVDDDPYYTGGAYYYVQAADCWRYALEAIMYDDICYVFMNKGSPWTLSRMCISKYVTCLWDYTLYDGYPKRSLVERAVWTRRQLD